MFQMVKRKMQAVSFGYVFRVLQKLSRVLIESVALKRIIVGTVLFTGPMWEIKSSRRSKTKCRDHRWGRAGEEAD
jgi:hypothetical protein